MSRRSKRAVDLLSTSAAAAAPANPSKRRAEKKPKVYKLPKGEIENAIMKSSILQNGLPRFESDLREPRHLKKHPSCVEWSRACFIFAQLEAGSAVCVSEKGEILTCCHCLGDEGAAVGMKRCLLSVTGDIVLTEAIKVDEKRDLALLRIVGTYDVARSKAKSPVWAAPAATYPFVRCLHEELYETGQPVPPIVEGTPIMNIGQPGQVDLESVSARRTGYPLAQVSVGRYRGVVRGSKDIHDNTDIGQLMHDSWTYWGHSGCPLMMQLEPKERGARLLGLHSSWDDLTCMRHGVHLLAILAFLKKPVVYVVDDSDHEDEAAHGGSSSSSSTVGSSSGEGEGGSSSASSTNSRT